MSTQRKVLFGLTTVIATLVFLTGMTIAGNLNPPASPAPTMHTLDEVYNKTGSALPNPDEVTIITKTHNFANIYNWETIHTVTTGKTFYLMGFICSSPVATYKISLDGGQSTSILVHAPDANLWRSIASSYPIGSAPSGTEIKCQASIQTTDISIWGYEK